MEIDVVEAVDSDDCDEEEELLVAFTATACDRVARHPRVKNNTTWPSMIVLILTREVSNYRERGAWELGIQKAYPDTAKPQLDEKFIWYL